MRVAAPNALFRRWFKSTGPNVGCLGFVRGVFLSLMYMWVGFAVTITPGMWIADTLFGTHEFYAGFFIIPLIGAYLYGTSVLWSALQVRRDRRNML